MAIVFASLSGIAGREAISNFVHKYIVPKSTSYGAAYRDGSNQSGTGLRADVRMAERHSWQKLTAHKNDGAVATVRELHETGEV